MADEQEIGQEELVEVFKKEVSPEEYERLQGLRPVPKGEVRTIGLIRLSNSQGWQELEDQQEPQDQQEQ